MTPNNLPALCLHGRRDAGLASVLRMMAHYEISRYGTATTYDGIRADQQIRTFMESLLKKLGIQTIR